MDPKRTVRLIAGGDVMLGRDVRKAVLQHGPGHPFAPIRDVLAGADLRFANLECVLPAPGASIEETTYDMWTTWEGALGLVEASFDVLSLANNHIMDLGDEAALATAAFCRRYGIASVGFGQTPAEARRPAVVERNGLEVGFLAYADDFVQLSRRTRPGPAYMSLDAMRADVVAAREAHDVVVVSLHADLEFVHHPAPWRVAACRELVKAGATVVLCHHPHVPQGIERFGDGLIAYSLGNFVYDATSRGYMVEGSPYSSRSVLLELTLAPGRVLDHRLHPFKLDERHRACPLQGPAAGLLLDAMEQWSADLADPARLEEAWAETCTKHIGLHLEAFKECYERSGPSEVVGWFLPRFFYGQHRPLVEELVRWLASRVPPEPS